jgi:hypothetical protein
MYLCILYGKRLAVPNLHENCVRAVLLSGRSIMTASLRFAAGKKAQRTSAVRKFDKITLECTISRSPFSGERIFSVLLPNAQEHEGAASPEYFLNEKGKPLQPVEPRAGKDIKHGRVMARFISYVEDDTALVSLPDGSVVTVTNAQLRALKEASPDVPVQP